MDELPRDYAQQQSFYDTLLPSLLEYWYPRYTTETPTAFSNVHKRSMETAVDNLLKVPELAQVSTSDLVKNTRSYQAIMYPNHSHQNSTISQPAETGLWSAFSPLHFLASIYSPSIHPLSETMCVFFIKPSVYAVQ